MKKALIMMCLAALTVGMLSGCKNKNAKTTDAENRTAESEWVDLGLPSGLLWACCNLGASSPEKCGDYYAWGETMPKNEYSLTTYSYYNHENGIYTLNKYNTQQAKGLVDSLTVLESADDAATALLGEGARIPTDAEWQELLDNTTAKWTTQNGVKGYLLTAANGNNLFLPAAGWMDGDSHLSKNTGDYWSSSLETLLPNNAHILNFGSTGLRVSNYERFHGSPIRPVHQN
ncbi:MAG: fibrobacter succinogenes major paralogous domain-containing protein [Bacteroidales bacterium]|nr:fibrobacter succinogenes major paralogous domain-containing protein [Bacteroidales bacterium]